MVSARAQPARLEAYQKKLSLYTLLDKFGTKVLFCFKGLIVSGFDITMTNLGIPLQKMPTEPATKMSIVNGLWLRRPSVRLQLDDLDWEAYFSYYYEQCKALRRISATTHQDIVDTTRYLEQLPSKSAIKQELRNQLPTSKLNDDQDELLEGSIILATRLFVMMDIGVPRLAFSGRPPLVWNDGDLKTFIHDYFNEPPMLGHEGIRLEPIFVARNLERVAGITIEWTSNLADHLRMTGDGDKTVAIFHHASFLRWNQRYDRFCWVVFGAYSLQFHFPGRFNR